MEQKEETAAPYYSLLTAEDKKLIQFSCGGLLAVDFLFIQSYVSLAQLDSYEQTALNCFVATIPFLVVFAIAASLLTVEWKSRWIKLGVVFFFSFVMMVNVYGLLNAFYHF